LQDAAAEGADAGVRGELRPGRLGPGPLQLQLALAPAPAAGGEQAPEDVAQALGAARRRVAVDRHRKSPPPVPSASAGQASAPRWRLGLVGLRLTSAASPGTGSPPRA